MLDERGRGDAPGVERRRVAAVRLQVIPELAGEVVGDEAGDVAGAGEADQVGHAGANARGLKAWRLRDRPAGQEPAVAPAQYRQPLGIGDAPLDERVHTGEHVLEI